jgi:predicted CoA-binding protein
MVINPKYGINTINEASELGIKNIWLQPGTYNDELLALIDEQGLNQVKACVLVELG